MPVEHWHEWRRLEAVVNLALARHNAWAVCAYDHNTLTDDRVEDLSRHPPPRLVSRPAPDQRALSGPGRSSPHTATPHPTPWSRPSRPGN